MLIGITEIVTQIVSGAQVHQNVNNNPPPKKSILTNLPKTSFQAGQQ